MGGGLRCGSLEGLPRKEEMFERKPDAKTGWSAMSRYNEGQVKSWDDEWVTSLL